MSHTYSASLIEKVVVEKTLPDSYRIIPKRYSSTPLGTARGDSRFCTKSDDYTVLYASPDFATAFIETVVRDRLTRKQKREINLIEVTERAWVLIGTDRLKLIDLRESGCVKLGAPTDVVNARNHAAGRTFGQTIHAGHADIDGILFSSRLTGADCYAIFDRAIHKLTSIQTGPLVMHTELPSVLEQYQISLLEMYTKKPG